MEENFPNAMDTPVIRNTFDSERKIIFYSSSGDFRERP